MRLLLKNTIVFAVLASCFGTPAWGVEMEDGPAYLTDSHGASGVVHAFLELSEVAPEYDKYWKGALNWLMSVAKRDKQGYLYWYMSTTAPKGHPSHRISIPGMCHVTRMFLAGYKRCGDERYRKTGLEAARTMVERFSRQKQTPYGTAWAWSHAYRPNDRTQGLLAGHSHGLGNLIDTLLDAYEAATDKAFKRELEEALTGLLVNLRARAVQTQKDGRMLIAWPSRRNRDVVETGYCYGQAGLVLPLLRLAEVFPNMKLSDGTTPLTLANGSLRYLMSVAKEARGGYVWPYMRHSKRSKNIGYGSGTAGIGWSFLRGAEVNRKIDPAFAEECMKYAKGAVTYAVNLVLNYKGPGRLKQPGGEAGFGVCGGAAGGGFLLIQYAQTVGDREPALVQRINRAVERIARMVVKSATEIDGTLACPDRTHFKRVNIALDYGQTGIVLGLSVAGKYLKNEKLIDAAKKVANYIAQRALPEGGGYKFAQFHPLPK
ncbi:MAG: hypothetical protein GXP27_00440 [Planctomycetes bacterium]|nr:hypothetical protein [Planctomycetota bacterium]